MRTSAAEEPQSPRHDDRHPRCERREEEEEEPSSLIAGDLETEGNTAGGRGAAGAVLISSSDLGGWGAGETRLNMKLQTCFLSIPKESLPANKGFWIGLDF